MPQLATIVADQSVHFAHTSTQDINEACPEIEYARLMTAAARAKDVSASALEEIE